MQILIILLSNVVLLVFGASIQKDNDFRLIRESVAIITNSSEKNDPSFQNNGFPDEHETSDNVNKDETKLKKADPQDGNVPADLVKESLNSPQDPIKTELEENNRIKGNGDQEAELKNKLNGLDESIGSAEAEEIEEENSNKHDTGGPDTDIVGKEDENKKEAEALGDGKIENNKYVDESEDYNDDKDKEVDTSEAANKNESDKERANKNESETTQTETKPNEVPGNSNENKNDDDENEEYNYDDEEYNYDDEEYNYDDEEYDESVDSVAYGDIIGDDDDDDNDGYDGYDETTEQISKTTQEEIKDRDEDQQNEDKINARLGTVSRGEVAKQNQNEDENRKESEKEAGDKEATRNENQNRSEFEKEA